jgi:tRNA (mo5U34)-methyltransferase
MSGEIQKQIEALGPWFHNIHLPDGSQTAPNHSLGDFPAFKWEKIQKAIPHDLSGWKVLDIGCNAGFYSIELAKRGAHVLAIDLDEHYLKQAQWTAAQFGLEDRINFKKMQVYDLVHLDEKFDLVWFMGVFYHLRYPQLALDIISSKVKGMLVFQTLSMLDKEILNVAGDIPFNQREVLNKPGYPVMAFIEKSLGGDHTNWWVPNHSAVLAMLRSCGFNVNEMPEDETYIAHKDPGLYTDFDTWNISEFLSATGQEWTGTSFEKTNIKHAF